MIRTPRAPPCGQRATKGKHRQIEAVFRYRICGTPLCPYGMAHCRICGLSTRGLFKTSLCFSRVPGFGFRGQGFGVLKSRITWARVALPGGKARPLFVGIRKCRKLRKIYVFWVNSVHLKEFLVQMHQIDSKYVNVSEFSSFLECLLIRHVL